jgi:hypothetical protein
VLDARGKLEREATTTNLDLRKVLSLAQWRQLKAIRGSAGFWPQDLLPEGDSATRRGRRTAETAPRRGRHASANLPGLPLFRATTLSIDVYPQ